MKSLRAAVVAALALSMLVVAPVASPAQAAKGVSGSSDIDANVGDDVFRINVYWDGGNWKFPVCDSKGGTRDVEWQMRHRGERRSPICETPIRVRYESDQVRACLMGFEVYRFYGTAARPTDFTTMSKANLKKGCALQRARARLFYPNPTDAHQPTERFDATRQLARLGSPYVKEVTQATYPIDGRSVALTHSNGVPTTLDPLAALGAETCRDLSQSVSVGKIEDWFSAGEDSPYRKDLQRIMHEAYMNGYQEMVDAGYPRVLADRYARGWAFIAERGDNPPLGTARNSSDVDPSVDYPYPKRGMVLEVPPISSPDQIISLGARGQCKSPFEFARVALQPAKDLNPETVPAIGTCVASLVAPGNVIVNRNWDATGDLEKWVPSYFQGAGSEYYGPKPNLSALTGPVIGRSGSSASSDSLVDTGLSRQDFTNDYIRSAKTLRKELKPIELTPFKEQIGGLASMFEGGKALPTREEFKDASYWYQPWVRNFDRAAKNDNIVDALGRSLVCDSMVLVLNLCTPNSPDWDPVTETCVKCSPENPDYDPATGTCEPADELSVTYDGNGHTAGLPPVDPRSPYQRNAVVRVLPKPADLVKDGHVFENWNTRRDGTGRDYSAGKRFRIRSDVTLYAQWEPVEVQAACNPSSPDWNSARGDCGDNPPPTVDPIPGGWHVKMTLSADEVFHVGGKEAVHTVSVMGGMSTGYKTLMCSATRPCGGDEMDPYLLYMSMINLDVVSQSSGGVAEYKECANSRERGCQFGQESVSPARWSGYFFSPTVEGQWLRPTAQVVAMVQTKVKKKYPVYCPPGPDGTGGGLCGYEERIELGPIVPVGAYSWVAPNNPVSVTSPRWRVVGSTGRAAP